MNEQYRKVAGTPRAGSPDTKQRKPDKHGYTGLLEEEHAMKVKVTKYMYGGSDPQDEDIRRS